TSSAHWYVDPEDPPTNWVNGPTAEALFPVSGLVGASQNIFIDLVTDIELLNLLTSKHTPASGRQLVLRGDLLDRERELKFAAGGEIQLDITNGRTIGFQNLHLSGDIAKTGAGGISFTDISFDGQLTLNGPNSF